MDTVSLKRFIDSMWIATLLTVLSITFSEFMGWLQYGDLNLWEVAATWASFSCTYMCVMQTRWNYPMAVVSTCLLAYVFWQSNLLASAILNLYLIPTVIYGFFIWGKDSETRPVEHVKWGILPVYVLFTVGAYAGAWGIVNYFGGELAALDSWLLIGSIFAQFLLDRKKIETWLVWISVNIVSIYVYFDSGLYLLAIQFAFFLANAVFGYYQWWRSMNNKPMIFGRQP